MTVSGSPRDTWNNKKLFFKAVCRRFWEECHSNSLCCSQCNATGMIWSLKSKDGASEGGVMIKCALYYPESHCMHTNSRCLRSLRPHSSQITAPLSSSSSSSSSFLCILTLICSSTNSVSSNIFPKHFAESFTYQTHLLLNVSSGTSPLMDERKTDPIHRASVWRLKWRIHNHRKEEGSGGHQLFSWLIHKSLCLKKCQKIMKHNKLEAALLLDTGGHCWVSDETCWSTE